MSETSLDDLAIGPSLDITPMTLEEFFRVQWLSLKTSALAVAVVSLCENDCLSCVRMSIVAILYGEYGEELRTRKLYFDQQNHSGKALSMIYSDSTDDRVTLIL